MQTRGYTYKHAQMQNTCTHIYTHTYAQAQTLKSRTYHSCIVGWTSKPLLSSFWFMKRISPTALLPHLRPHTLLVLSTFSAKYSCFFFRCLCYFLCLYSFHFFRSLTCILSLAKIICHSIYLPVPKRFSGIPKWFSDDFRDSWVYFIYN